MADYVSLRHEDSEVPLRIERVEDKESATSNCFITSGGKVKIFGQNLRITGDQTGLGIKFISVNDAEVIYPVSMVDLLINHPTELLIVAPPMNSDDSVQLQITTQYSGSSNQPLKAPRTTVFEKVLTVQSGDEATRQQA
ncbi:MAG: DUF4469 domain-containing protein [Dysgonamonadaceae bacterium]|jgi:hypothetical protein|nr:DUF4469 domain-containing protein [Dysgonamonadaceae bacterium]